MFLVEKQNKTKLITVKCTEEQREEAKKIAEEAGMDLSKLVMELLELQRTEKVIKKRED